MLRKGSAILTTLMILFGIVIISFLGSDIIMNGLKRRRAEGASAKAFYAAEAAVEMTTLAFKKNPSLLDSCAVGEKDFSFVDNSCKSIGSQPETLMENQSGLPTYKARVSVVGQNVSISSRGTFQGTARSLFVSFCLPKCVVGECGNDGCQGKCLCSPGQTCNDTTEKCE